MHRPAFLSRARVIALSLALTACSNTLDRAVAPHVIGGSASHDDGGSPHLAIVELMPNPSKVADASGEYFKLYNPGPVDVNLQNYRIQSASGTTVYTGTQTVENHIITGSIVVPVGSCVILGNNTNTATNGGITEPYSYGTSITLGNNTTDWLTIKTSTGAILDSVSYSGATIDFTKTPAARTITTPTYDANASAANGTSRVVVDPSVDHSIAGNTDWANATSVLTDGDKGEANNCPYTWRFSGGGVGPLDHVAISGPATVSVGGTAQLSAVPQDASNATVGSATLAWTTSDPSIATVDNTGLVTGVAASATPAVITATATSGDIVKAASQNMTVTVPTINWIDVSASSTSFPPGFQAQMFATARVSSGGTIIPATFTFTSLDPSIATATQVGNTAIITGVSASATRPRIQIVATPTGGGDTYTFTTASITIETPAPAPTSIYGTNDELGDPTTASTSTPNDFLVVRPQYTISYNQARGTPNWVSYELDARQMVPGQDRCNCFTADPLLPPSAQIFTSDYTNGGFDRGHMTRSADRTAGNTDNAATFYLTNVVPQTADLNEGVWAALEDSLADSASIGGRAVYIMTGPIFTKGSTVRTLQSLGKVGIPDSTWKIAIIGPMIGGVPFTHAAIKSRSDLAGFSVIAVNMPNIAGVRGDPWKKYSTTIAKIEASTGFNFLSNLDESIQCVIEVRDCLPQPKAVSASGSNSITAGGLFTLNVSAADADGADGPWKLVIDWGDGSNFTSTLFALPTDLKPLARGKVWSAPGTYTVNVTVTDKKGGAATTSLTITVH